MLKNSSKKFLIIKKLTFWSSTGLHILFTRGSSFASSTTKWKPGLTRVLKDSFVAGKYTLFTKYFYLLSEKQSLNF